MPVTRDLRAMLATTLLLAASWLLTAANPAMATSSCPDLGATWTSRTSAVDNEWTSVTWGGPTGQQKFVAVAYDGTGNRVMTSPDGITWTTQTSAADNNHRCDSHNRSQHHEGEEG